MSIENMPILQKFSELRKGDWFAWIGGDDPYLMIEDEQPGDIPRWVDLNGRVYDAHSPGDDRYHAYVLILRSEHKFSAKKSVDEELLYAEFLSRSYGELIKHIDELGYSVQEKGRVLKKIFSRYIRDNYSEDINAAISWYSNYAVVSRGRAAKYISSCLQ